jgi:sarcosine oxidase subunit gamma
MLAKGVSIDLHPDCFRVGDVALTAVSHLHVALWQISDEPRYRVLVARTYFESFWRWLSASAAEFGGEVLPPQEYAGS